MITLSVELLHIAAGLPVIWPYRDILPAGPPRNKQFTSIRYSDVQSNWEQYR